MLATLAMRLPLQALTFNKNAKKKEITNLFKHHSNVKHVIMSSTREPGVKSNYNVRLSAVRVSLQKVSSLSEHLILL